MKLTTRTVAPLLLAALGAAGGCGTRQYPVTGVVTLDDGTPLDKGMLVFESADRTRSARANIQPDGKYEVGTLKAGDGVEPGVYRVLINPMVASDAPLDSLPLPFDIKYVKFETSGLEFEVKAEPNAFPIKLNRASPGRKVKPPPADPQPEEPK